MSKDSTQHKLVPRLRFPEFRDAQPWTAKALDEYCERLTDTVGDAQLTPVSISSGVGFVAQAEKFGRDISGAQYANYIRIRRGDFAYNRGNSKRFPQGCVYRLTEFDEAAASNAFYCFCLHPDYEPAFFEGLFESNCHGRQLIKHITSSARSTGLLNIRSDTFFGITIPMPLDNAEHRKIAECLGSLDDLIAAEGRKLDALQNHKQGLMQQLFPREGESQPRLRFPDFCKEDWVEGRCSDIADVLQGYGFPERHQGKGEGEFPFCKVSDISKAVEQGRRFIDCANNWVDESILHELRAKPIPAGTTVFAKIGEAIRLNRRVMTAIPALIDNNTAGVKAINDKVSDEFLFYLWSTVSLIEFAGGVVPAVSKTAIENIPVSYPALEEEQAQIVGCLASLDDQIVAQAEVFVALRAHKTGLMQQLFPSLEDVEA